MLSVMFALCLSAKPAEDSICCCSNNQGANLIQSCHLPGDIVCEVVDIVNLLKFAISRISSSSTLRKPVRCVATASISMFLKCLMKPTMKRHLNYQIGVNKKCNHSRAVVYIDRTTSDRVRIPWTCQMLAIPTAVRFQTWHRPLPPMN